MNILSLDLDFFMHGIAHSRGDSLSDRPNDHGIEPWTAPEVTAFLDDVLNVPASSPGRVVTSHHEVFFAWRDAIDSGLIQPPFFVCHVDAHSDLGMGLPSWIYLHSEFLELAPAQRAYPMEGQSGLNFGSFMPFAIGNRWISQVDFITSESWSDDIPRYLLSDRSLAGLPDRIYPPSSLEIELMYAPRAEITRNCLTTNFCTIRRGVGEPATPFAVLNGNSLGNRYAGFNWDFVFLSHSPGYVPETADHLLGLVGKRIHAF